MKKILLILLFITLFVIANKLGAFREADELIETRSNYSQIYGEKAEQFIFSK